MDRAGVPFRGQERLTDEQFPAEVIHLVVSALVPCCSTSP
jgi:hypothetical protein